VRGEGAAACLARDSAHLNARTRTAAVPRRGRAGASTGAATRRTPSAWRVAAVGARACSGCGHDQGQLICVWRCRKLLKLVGLAAGHPSHCAQAVEGHRHGVRLRPCGALGGRVDGIAGSCAHGLNGWICVGMLRRCRLVGSRRSWPPLPRWARHHPATTPSNANSMAYVFRACL
jgi:hypothetical protein